MTRAQEERLRAENRRKEYEREDNKRLVAQDHMLRVNVACDERVENKRFIRRVEQVIVLLSALPLVFCPSVCI